MGKALKPVNVVEYPIGKNKESDIEKIMDDYLDQNARTVRNSLKNDNLSQRMLEKLLKEEKNNKDRKTVLSEIKRQLGD